MTDKVSSEIRSRTMRAVKSKDSKIEVKFRSGLWKVGLRFFKNVNSLVGKPDIVFPRLKIVIFIDSCFWHGCPEHLRLPKSNLDYWQPKIERNKNRDIDVNNYYLVNGWHIIRIWEHELKNDFDNQISQVERLIRKRQNGEQ